MIIEIFGEEVDKTGETLLIKHTSSLAYSPAYSFFLRQMSEVIDNNHGYRGTSWKDDQCGVIWAERNSNIYGVCVYDKTKVEVFKMLTRALSAVDIQYRERGIHSILNKHFEETAKKLGCLISHANVKFDHTAILKATEKDGLKIKYNQMYKLLT